MSRRMIDDLDQSQRMLSQVNASARKDRVARRPRFSPSIYLRVRLKIGLNFSSAKLCHYYDSPLTVNSKGEPSLIVLLYGVCGDLLATNVQYQMNDHLHKGE